MRVGSVECDAEKEADPVPHTVAALPGHPALLVQVEQLVPDLQRGDVPRALLKSGCLNRTWTALTGSWQQWKPTAPANDTQTPVVFAA